MLKKEANDYAAYVNLDLTYNFQIIQDIIDSLLTRLEELSSVVQMIKLKNNDCRSIVTDDLHKYRIEIVDLSKKVIKVNDVLVNLQSHVDELEKCVVKAETDFGINYDNKLTSFLKPFFRKSKDNVASSSSTTSSIHQEKIVLPSVLDNFNSN